MTHIPSDNKGFLKRLQGFAAVFNHQLMFLTLLSFMISLLNLTLPLYMLQVYDRIFMTENVNSLLFITGVALMALLALGGLQSTRGKMIENIASLNDRQLSQRYPQISDQAISPFLDLMWCPIFIMMSFRLNAALGFYVLAAFILQMIFGIFTKLNNHHAITEQQKAHDFQSFRFFKGGAARLFYELKTNLGRKIKRFQNQARFIDNHFALKKVQQMAFNQVSRLMMQIGVLCLGAFQVIHADLSPGAVIAVSILLNLILSPLDRAKGYIDHFIALFTPPHICVSDKGENVKNMASLVRINLSHITHLYPGQTSPLFHNLSAQIEAGKITGITGATMSGKTSLTHLISGLERPRKGHVFFEFKGGLKSNIMALKYPIALMDENSKIVRASIRDNIGLYSSKKFPDIQNAAIRAGIDDFILGLPAQYDTIIDQGTPLLSSTIKQMLFFARAICMDAPVMILDNPERGLDTEFRHILMTQIMQFGATKKTVILFTQSKLLMEIAQDQLFLKQGKLYQHQKIKVKK